VKGLEEVITELENAKLEVSVNDQKVLSVAQELEK
jgi:hypothetical protein